MFLLSSFRNTVSLPKETFARLSDQTQNFREGNSSYRISYTLLDNKYAEACKWDKGLRIYKELHFIMHVLVPLLQVLIEFNLKKMIF